MSGQQDPNQSKNDYAILWILAVIALIGGLVWWFFDEQLKQAYLFIRIWEAKGAALFTDNLDNMIYAMQSMLPSSLTMSDVIKSSEEIGKFWMYPSIGILVLMALFMLKNHGFMRWHTKHNMETLIRQEQKNWPQISPVVPLDLVEQDINKGPWAMAQNPMQFAKATKILDVEKVQDTSAAWRATENYKAVLNKERTYRVLVNQMGPMWEGVNRLPPHTKALFAICCARSAHKADEALAYLGELASEAAKGEMRYGRTEEFLKKYGSEKAVKRCTERHAYVYTLMASMVELARVDGVFASADFLWLKPVERKLWYMLNTVGRQTCPAEVAGPWAHWLAEKEMHRALSVPMVDEAMNALERALNMMVYVPDEEEEEMDFPQETPEKV